MIHGKPPPSLEALMGRLGVDPAAAQGGVASIGSIGSSAVPLNIALDRCRAAEAQLDSAREAARVAARHEGKKVGGLFVSSKYILRESGEKWANEARAEGVRQGHEWLADKLEAARDPNRDRPFRLAGEAMMRAKKENREFGRVLGRERSGAPGMSEVDKIQADIRKRAEVDLSSNAGIGAPTTSEGLVAGIHEAAAKARTRTGGHKDDNAPMNALSKAIVAAGKKRRMEDGQ